MSKCIQVRVGFFFVGNADAHPFDNYIAQPPLTDDGFGGAVDGGIGFAHRWMGPPRLMRRAHRLCQCAIRQSPANSVCLAAFPDDRMHCCPS